VTGIARETIGQRFSSGHASTGFDYLRIGLSCAICLWHAWWALTGQLAWHTELWSGWLNFIPKSFVPLFFALSGFLVAGSLERNKLHHFITLRALRIIPALAFEIVISACIIGVIFTSLPLDAYLTSPEFRSYFLNVMGIIQYTLPGVFPHNPLPELMNPQLWTIPYELECYLAISVLAVLGLVWQGYRLGVVVAGMMALGTAYALYVALRLPDGLFTEHAGNISGRVLVVVFLAGVLLYRHRDRLPYSHALGVLSLLAMMVALRFPAFYYLSVLPVAYVAAWIGVMRPPAIPFGDLSYGVFLFHFPMTQVVVALGGAALGTWWLFGPVALVASALCAAVSWKLVEEPLLTKKRAIIGWVDGTWTKLRPARS
jgi:peptidoglycan/LPS O-acetylase OafA/YrhL